MWHRYAAIHAYKKSQTLHMVEEARQHLNTCRYLTSCRYISHHSACRYLTHCWYISVHACRYLTHCGYISHLNAFYVIFLHISLHACRYLTHCLYSVGILLIAGTYLATMLVGISLTADTYLKQLALELHLGCQLMKV